MKFTNKIGVYTLQGQALKNFHKMQCRPAYKRYKMKLRRKCQSKGFPRVEPIPFDVFCDLHIAEVKQAEQGNLF